MDGRDGFSRIEFDGSSSVVEDSKEFVVLPLSGVHHIAVYVACGIGIGCVLFGKVGRVIGIVVP